MRECKRFVAELHGRNRAQIRYGKRLEADALFQIQPAVRFDDGNDNRNRNFLHVFVRAGNVNKFDRCRALLERGDLQPVKRDHVLRRTGLNARRNLRVRNFYAVLFHRHRRRELRNIPFVLRVVR